jgi:5-methylcytosine-specific restriction endonuclease McrA
MRRRLTNGVRMQIAAEHRWQCYLCHSMLEAQFEIDHAIALCLGGRDEYDNLRPVCRPCHAKKTLMEVTAVNSRSSAPYCFRCDCHFSKYFMAAHIHG